jgi:two-component system phosphate regulon sensor histidine kinase PhoR
VISRFLSFLSLLAFGAAIGFSWSVMGDKQPQSLYLLTGALLAGLAWMLIDGWRGYRVRSWLRHGDLAMAPQLSLIHI